MQRFEEHREVGAQPDAVWAVLTDPGRLSDWLTIARSVDAEGDPGEGQTLHVTGGHLGVSRTVTARVDVWEPTARYGWASDDPLALRFRYHLTAGSDATRLHAAVAADLAGLPRVATRLAVRSLRREFARSLDRLAQLTPRG